MKGFGKFLIPGVPTDTCELDESLGLGTSRVLHYLFDTDHDDDIMILRDPLKDEAVSPSLSIP